MLREAKQTPPVKDKRPKADGDAVFSTNFLVVHSVHVTFTWHQYHQDGTKVAAYHMHSDSHKRVSTVADEQEILHREPGRCMPDNMAGYPGQSFAPSSSANDTTIYGLIAARTLFTTLLVVLALACCKPQLMPASWVLALTPTRTTCTRVRF